MHGSARAHAPKQVIMSPDVAPPYALTVPTFCFKQLLNSHTSCRQKRTTRNFKLCALTAQHNDCDAHCPVALLRQEQVHMSAKMEPLLPMQQSFPSMHRSFSWIFSPFLQHLCFFSVPFATFSFITKGLAFVRMILRI